MQQKILHRETNGGPETPLTGYLGLRAQDFVHPREVLSDAELDPFEKRTILAAWASDMSAVPSHPQFRWLAGTLGPVPLSQILGALKHLDAQTEQQSAVFSTMAKTTQGANRREG
jgi:hypothetical protein